MILPGRLPTEKSSKIPPFQQQTRPAENATRRLPLQPKIASTTLWLHSPTLFRPGLPSKTKRPCTRFYKPKTNTVVLVIQVAVNAASAVLIT